MDVILSFGNINLLPKNREKKRMSYTKHFERKLKTFFLMKWLKQSKTKSKWTTIISFYICLSVRIKWLHHISVRAQQLWLEMEMKSSTSTGTRTVANNHNCSIFQWEMESAQVDWLPFDKEVSINRPISMVISRWLYNYAFAFYLI